jgi:hypothetical protein
MSTESHRGGYSVIAMDAADKRMLFVHAIEERGDILIFLTGSAGDLNVGPHLQFPRQVRRRRLSAAVTNIAEISLRFRNFRFSINYAFVKIERHAAPAIFHVNRAGFLLLLKTLAISITKIGPCSSRSGRMPPRAATAARPSRSPL